MPLYFHHHLARVFKCAIFTSLNKFQDLYPGIVLLAIERTSRNDENGTRCNLMPFESEHGQEDMVNGKSKKL